jgi:hypothetical protein
MEFSDTNSKKKMADNRFPIYNNRLINQSTVIDGEIHPLTHNQLAFFYYYPIDWKKNRLIDDFLKIIFFNFNFFLST